MSDETFKKFGSEPCAAWGKPGQKVQVELGAIDALRSCILISPDAARTFAAALLAAADREEGKS